MAIRKLTVNPKNTSRKQNLADTSREAWRAERVSWPTNTPTPFVLTPHSKRQLAIRSNPIRWAANMTHTFFDNEMRKMLNHNAKELPKCLKRFGISDPSISVANGSGATNNQYYANEALAPINTNNPQLQQVIKTCNYWIQQHNQNASENNRVMRNTACENVTRMRRELSNNNPQEQFTPVRSLKECAKPNNVFDNEVKECMQGLREPNWITINN